MQNNIYAPFGVFVICKNNFCGYVFHLLYGKMSDNYYYVFSMPRL